MIYDDSDCVESCNLIQLVYDHNMKFADAFDSEVEQVSLLAFDAETGLLVQRMDVEEDKLTDKNEIYLNLDPGKYNLLVWAGRHSDSFDIADGVVGQSKIEDFHCRMNREEGGHINDDLARLYHGTLTLDAGYASPSNPQKSIVYLKKDTNVVRVVLQHITGERVNCDDFDFKITDSNGWLNHDNSLRDDEQLTYHPWYLFSGSVDINTDPEDVPGTKSDVSLLPDTRASLGAALAEFTTGRLIWGAEPILTITDKAKGRTVMRININDYAMLVKGMYNKNMSEQEYLDRQDEYNMTFFLDEGNRWISTVVIINDWRIVRNVTPVE
nr:hypothetical protein Muribac2_070 [uncultured Muribaculaceae bacterium]